MSGFGKYKKLFWSVIWREGEDGESTFYHHRIRQLSECLNVCDVQGTGKHRIPFREWWAFS